MNIKKEVSKILLKEVDQDFIQHTIPFTVNRYFTDVNGQIVDKLTVPSALQVKYPFFLLGEFDRQGGYKQGLAACPPQEGTYYLTSGVNGVGWTSYSVTGPSGVNQIQGNLKVGDIVHVYTDNIETPTYFIWVVTSSRLVSLASITSNTKTEQRDNKFDRLFVKEIHYTANPNLNYAQYNEEIVQVRLNNIGLAKTDSIVPLGMYETPFTFLRNILILPWRFAIDQYLGLYTYFAFNTDNLQFVLKLYK